MRHLFLILPLALGFSLSACNAQDRGVPAADNLEDRAAYILGHDIGMNVNAQILQLEEQQTQLSRDAVLDGFRAGLRGDTLDLTDEEIEEVMMAFQQQVTDRAGAATRAEGEAFLEEYDRREDVSRTESGLRYRVLEEGEGETPDANDLVTIHYEGRLPDGTVFDSSHQRGQPATFPVEGVVPGFSEALQLMQPGGRYEIVLPPELGYGDQAPPIIGPGRTLIFDVELIEIQTR